MLELMSRQFYFRDLSSLSATEELSETFFRRFFFRTIGSSAAGREMQSPFHNLPPIDDFEKLTFLWQEWLRLTSCCSNV